MRSYHLPLPLLLTACAPQVAGVQGGTLIPYNQFTSKAEKVYTAGACTDRKGAPVSSPDEVEYELHRLDGLPQLIEHSLTEDQARLMNNRWEDEAGVHYFIWLKDVRGFEYVVPGQAGKPALRRVYRAPQVRVVKSRGQRSVQPVGAPDIVCELLAMK